MCGHKFAAGGCTDYEIVNYASEAAAFADGAVVTHYGPCAACSTRQDLAVYMYYFDMTTVGKQCGEWASTIFSKGVRCFENLGMTSSCAYIWASNAKFDGSYCRSICLKDYYEPYNGAPPTCPLNDCLQCDEDNAGPLFKKFSGRTRRNSGLESSITRPCDTVESLTHYQCGTPTFDEFLQ